MDLTKTRINAWFKVHMILLFKLHNRPMETKIPQPRAIQKNEVKTSSERMEVGMLQYPAIEAL